MPQAMELLQFLCKKEDPLPLSNTHKYFLEQRLSSEEQQKRVKKMLGYDFEIIYKKG